MVFLIPLVVFLIVLGGAAGWSAARGIQEAFTAQQLGDLAYFAASARQSLRSGSPAVIEEEVRRFHEVHGVEVAVFDLTGRLWASGGDADEVLSDDDAERLRLALSGRRAEPADPVVPWIVSEAPMIDPVFDDGDVIGAVMVDADAEAPRTEILHQALVLIAVAVVAIGLGVMLVIGLARWVLSPVRRLDDAMMAIEHGEMDARVAEDTGPPELRRMTRVFNGMADEIERVMTRQQEFALNASHELRNPLNALLLRVEHLATGLDSSWDDDVAETREEGRRMARILEALLALAREDRSETEFSAVDLTTLAARRAEAWGDVAAQRGIVLQADARGAVMSLTDRTIVESALDAVIDNAVKFSPDDGVIEISAMRDDDGCLIIVRDHGPGLTPEQAEAATDRFWRGDEADRIPGTGLGLAIATDLLRSISGRLRVDEAEGGGLRVSLVLPDEGGS